MQPYSDKHIIDEKFKEKLNGVRIKPSSKAWVLISSQLSQAGSSEVFRKSVSIITLVSLGIAFGVFSVLQPADKNNVLNNMQELSTRSNPLAEESQHSGLSSLKEEAHPIHSNSFYQHKNQTAEIIETTLEEVFSSPVIEGRSETALNTVKDRHAMLNLPERQIDYSLTEEAESSNDMQNRFDSPKENCNLQVSGFYIGGGTALNSSWLLSSKTIADKSIQYKMTFGPSASLNVGYILCNHFALESGIRLSNQGQQYEYNAAYGRTSSVSRTAQTIDLNYLQVPLIWKLRMQKYSSIARAPVFLDYSVGIQYGRLVSSQLKDEESTTSVSNTFHKNEAAVIAGLAYEIHTSKSYFLNVGLYSSYGTNIIIGNEVTPLEFSKAHNFLVGAQATINFNLSNQ